MYRGCCDMHADCPLIQLPRGMWWCPVPGCDPHHRRLLPGNYRRNCRATSRDRVEADLVDDPRRTRSMADIAVDLNKCFGGCEHFQEGACDRHPKRCERYEVWMERLREEGCEFIQNSIVAL